MFRIALLAWISGCGVGTSEGGPSGLILSVGDVPQASGTLVAEFSGVPVRQLLWPVEYGQNVQNNVGHTSIAFSRDDSVPVDVNDAFEAELVGSADVFQTEVFVFPGGAAQVDVWCIPPAVGTYETELRARIAGQPGWTGARITCAAVDDYAMIPGPLSLGFGAEGNGLLINHLNRYDLPSRDFLSGTPDDGLPPPAGLVAIADDDRTAAIPRPDASGDPFGFYLWDVQTNEQTPILTADEALQHLDWMGSHSAALSADGRVAAMASFRSGMFVKNLDDGTLTEVPAPGDTVQGLSLFGVNAAGSEVIFGAAGASAVLTGATIFSYQPASGLVTPILGPTARAQLGSLDWINHVRFDTAAEHLLIGRSYFGSVQMYGVDRTADTVQPLFEGFMAHMDEREGAKPDAITVPSGTSLTRNGRYAGLAINRWHDPTYWAGSRFVFVEDLQTGDLYSVGFMPDGSPLSGDGWMTGNVHVSDDGEYAAFSVSWSGGVSGLTLQPFTVVVPRRMWVKVAR